MLFNSTKLTLSNTMMIGVIMTICANNWITMWIGMEMVLISFIPLMNSTKNSSSSESMVKYFIMQTISSTMFMFSVICMLIGVSMLLNEIMLMTSMIIKMGSAPFHNWVLMVIESIEYSIVLIFLTILKIPPLTVMYHINSKFLTIPVMMGLIISSVSCINQSSMRKTLVFSSIFNLSLMLTSITKFNLMFTFLLVYSTNLMFLTEIFKYMKINYINQIMFNEFSLWMKLNVWINLLSLSGFPPSIGFVTKLMIIQELISMNQLLLTMILMLSSLLVLLFYTRMAFSSMMISYSFKKWSITIKTKPAHFIMSMSILIFPIILTMKTVF
uniref:NADH dehydrogenase subunit 2 n=1 Tax=Zahniserius cylindricus TaxID=1671255 RepID=UPI002435512E|nr:NADH dehydrogenase subunit 2 [Zahniserius cylindricus]WEU77795.1 NADH dehydrogenase subunit 2 [Zahniserius cylindricus]